MKIDRLELLVPSDAEPINQTQAIILVDFFINKYSLSQRNALALLSHIQDEFNWKVVLPSQATLTRKLKAFQSPLDSDDTIIVLADSSVQTREDIDDRSLSSMKKIKLWVKVTPADINVSFTEPAQHQHISQQQKNLTCWIDENSGFIEVISRMLAVESPKLYELFIPLYPRRKLVKREWNEDIFDEYRFLAQRKSIEAYLSHEILNTSQQQTVFNSEYFKAIVINAQFETEEDGLEQLEMVMLICKRTSMILVGILHQDYRLENIQALSVCVKKKKHLHLYFNQEEHGYPIRYLARFSVNDVDDKHENVKSFASELKSKEAVCIAESISVKTSAITLTFDKSINTRIAAGKRISQWVRWVNFRNAALNNSDVDFYFGFEEHSHKNGDSKFISTINELI